jgi:carboxymethylenebutenolidase
MYWLAKATNERDRPECFHRRLFIEWFALALGSYPPALGLLGRSTLAAAQTGSDNIQSGTVKYPGDGVTLEGYLSRPKGKGPFPAVIIVHHNRGLIEHFLDVSRRLASQGYAALAVDLLSRQGGTAAFATPDAATKAFQKENDDALISDLNAAYQYLNSNSAVKNNDIAIMGFAAGGQKTFLYVTTNPKLKAAIIYYGSAPPDDKLARIQCPVLEIVGDKDARFAPAVPVLQEKMKELGKSYEWKIYPGVDHDFFEDSDERYNEAAAKESWAVVLEFLKRNLG